MGLTGTNKKLDYDFWVNDFSGFSHHHPHGMGPIFGKITFFMLRGMVNLRDFPSKTLPKNQHVEAENDCFQVWNLRKFRG